MRDNTNTCPAEAGEKKRRGRPPKCYLQKNPESVTAWDGTVLPGSFLPNLHVYNVFLQTNGSLQRSAVELSLHYGILRKLRAEIVSELEEAGVRVPDAIRDGFRDDDANLPSGEKLEAERDHRVCPHTQKRCVYWRTCEFNTVFAHRADACENNLGSVARCQKCGKWLTNDCEFSCFRLAFEKRTGKRLSFGLDTSGRTSSSGDKHQFRPVSDPHVDIWK